jgi:hypothetical protein
MATVTIATRSLKKGKAYVVQYVDPATAQKIYHKSFRRKDLAQEEVNRLRTLLDGGQFPEKKPRKGAVLPLPTFGQAARICKEEWRRKLGENNISENTHAGYISLLTPVEIMWRHTLLRDITVDDVRDYRIEIAQKTKADLKRQGKEGKN